MGVVLVRRGDVTNSEGEVGPEDRDDGKDNPL